MDRCPNEILSLIFADACTDGGYTGRSLSLVSKRIRTASRRFALRSVALYGPYQLSAFADYLETLAPEDRRVQYLFMTDRRRLWMEYTPGQDLSDWMRERVEEDFRIMDPSREYSSEPINRIFKLVCSCVHHVTFLLFDRYDENATAAAFPCLREVTFYGSIFNLSNVSFEIPDCSNLRRIHIIQDFSLRKKLIELIAILAPSLTHLRLSRLVSRGYDVQTVVKSLRGMVDGENVSGPHLPPTIKRVVIELSEQGSIGREGAQMPLSSIAKDLKDLATRDKRGRIILLHPHIWDPVGKLTGRDTDVELYMRLRKDWEDRILGLEGMWDVDPSEILATHQQADGQEENVLTSESDQGSEEC